MIAMLNAEPVGYQSVYVIQHREKCTQLVEESPSPILLREELIKSWNFLSAPHAFTNINKTTTVWASQVQIKVHYGYISLFFRKCSS